MPVEPRQFTSESTVRAAGITVGLSRLCRVDQRLAG